MREARDSELRLGCACVDEMVALLTVTANGDSFSRPDWMVSCISWQQQEAVSAVHYSTYTNAGRAQSAR